MTAGYGPGPHIAGVGQHDLVVQGRLVGGADGDGDVARPCVGGSASARMAKVMGRAAPRTATTINLATPVRTFPQFARDEVRPYWLPAEI